MVKRVWELALSLCGSLFIFAVPGAFLGLSILFGERLMNAVGSEMGTSRSILRLLRTVGYLLGTSSMAIGIVAVGAAGCWWMLGRMYRHADNLDRPQPRGEEDDTTQDGPAAVPAAIPAQPIGRRIRQSRSRFRGLAGIVRGR